MTYQLTFYFDDNKCIDCKTCEQACVDYYSSEAIHTNTHRYEPNPNTYSACFFITCFHCKNPTCVAVCPEKNFQKRYDGIVVRKSDRCQLCLRCIKSCPFHAIKLNPRTNKITKCNFCVERIDQGLKPVCIENCITGALSLIKVNNHNQTPTPITFSNYLTPMMGYSNPSIMLAEKKIGKTFLRKGDH